MKGILKMESYQFIESELSEMRRAIVDYENDMKAGLDAFENNQIVQDFYQSGRYGSDIKERIIAFRAAVNEYLDALSRSEDSLLVQTEKYINNQMDLLQQPSKGYSNVGSAGSLYNNSVNFNRVDFDKVGVLK